METTTQSLTSNAPAEPSMSIWSRFVAVFARPAQAWVGLERRGQWWFPLVLGALVSIIGTGVTYQRALVPTQLAQIDRRVESGQIPPESLDQIERQVTSPVSMVVTLASIAVAVPVMTLAFALVPWLAAGFMLGRRFRYRDAFVVTAWAGLVNIPAQILTSVLAWTNESMTNLHVGFGVLLPVEDPPSKLMVGLGTFLDQGIGPFALWYLAVIALGAAALTGGPRRPVVLALGGVWLVVIAIISVLAGVLTPAG